MIKLNVAQLAEHPVHTAVFVMDLALLVALGPPLLFSLLLIGLLVWLTAYFVVNSERSEKFSIVCASAAKPAAAAPAPAKPATAAAVAAPAAAAPKATVAQPAPAAEAKPAAKRAAGTTKRASTRKKDA